MKRRWIAFLLAAVTALSLSVTACKKQIDPPSVPQGAEVEHQNVPLGNFEITAPQANSVTSDINPRIVWTEERNAEKYLVALSENSDFTEICAEETTVITNVTVSATLKYSTKYYVRIYAMKKGASGADTAVSYRSTVFFTQEKHETPVPDVTKVRTIYDFEEFSDDYALGERFIRHTGGDDFIPTLAKGEGANGSVAMKLTYNRSDKGWAAVQSINPPDKKNWGGADGIKFWLLSDGSGGKFTVSIGKRGYQRWSAAVTLNAIDPCYVTIPFTAFEDAGGGDGVWDLTGIVRLWFYYHPTSSTKTSSVLIDDITIGAGGEYLTDTRGKAAEIPKKRIVTDTPFETFDNASDANKWKLVYDVNANRDLIKSVSQTGLKVYDPTSFGTNEYTLEAAEYDFSKTDFSAVNGFRMKITSAVFNNSKDAVGVVATLTVTIGSEGNYYQAVKEFFKDNNSSVMVCDFAAMKAVNGSDKPIDKSKIDTLKITCKGVYPQTNAHQFAFDDMEFYTAANGSQGVAFAADFSGSGTQNWNDGITIKDGAGTATDAKKDIQYTNDKWVNYQNTYAIRFSVDTTNVTSIAVSLKDGSGNGLRYTALIDGDGLREITIYYGDMSSLTETHHTSMKFRYIVLYINYGGTGSAVFDKIELLIG